MEGVNQEIRNRIRLSVAAYAYEYKDDPIMSDDDFDKLAKKNVIHKNKASNLKSKLSKLQ